MLNPQDYLKKLIQELGVADPEPKVVEQFEGHLSKIILEVLLRRMPEEKLPELRSKFEADAPDLEDYVTSLAAEVPGLGVEIEEAVLRELEVIKSLLKK